MDFSKLIDGVSLTPLKIISNPLGNVYHGLKAEESSFVEFGEAYFSTVPKGTIKPWKKHTRMTLNIIVPVGQIKFVLYDDREESKSTGCFFEISLSLQNYFRITIPPNIWVAFSGEGENNLLLNIANLSHDPDEVVRKDLEFLNYTW